VNKPRDLRKPEPMLDAYAAWDDELFDDEEDLDADSEDTRLYSTSLGRFLTHEEELQRKNRKKR